MARVPMSEATLLSLAGGSPSTERLAETLGDFLVSHGFEGAAGLLRARLDAFCDYDGDPDFFGDGSPFPPAAEDPRAIAFAEGYVP